MTERMIDLSEGPARLRVENALLVVEREEAARFTVPLDEVTVLVVSHPVVTFTQAVLAGLAEAGGAFVACDARHMPVGMMLPLHGHHTQAERFAAQAAASLPLKKRLWQQVVKAKIRAQGHLLERLRAGDHGLLRLARQVRSGDTQNVEARASQRYWPALFDDPRFARNRDADDQNRHLNYGYAVLRAIVGRAICASGLHPSLGIHHHNRYDAFCLADDLMEPFRPLVDQAVVDWLKKHEPSEPLDRQARGFLLEALTGRLSLEAEQRTLFDVAARAAASLAAAFEGKRKGLRLAELSL